MSLLIDKSTVSSAVAATQAFTSLGAPCKPVRLQETSGSSLVFFAHSGVKQPAYCLKVRKPVRSIPPSKRKADQLSTALEYEMIVRVRQHFSHFPEFSHSLARPVRLFVDQDAILTEYAGGQLLKEKLPWWGNVVTSAWHAPKLRRVSEMCGAWVSLLHKMHPPEWLPVRHLDSESAQQNALEAAARLPEPLRHHLPIHDLLGQIREMRLHHQHLAVSHGDFQPGNILVSGSQITVIDLGIAGVRAIEDDLAFFVTLTFMQKHRTMFGNLVGSRALVRELCDAFLAAYGFAGADRWSRLRPMLAAHIVERLAQMSDTIQRFPGIVRPFLIRRLVAWTRSELPLLLEWR